MLANRCGKCCLNVPRVDGENAGRFQHKVAKGRWWYKNYKGLSLLLQVYLPSSVGTLGLEL